MRTDSVDVDANSTDADVTSLSAKAIFIPIRILCLYSLIPNNPSSQWILYQNFTRSAHSYTGPGPVLYNLKLLYLTSSPTNYPWTTLSSYSDPEQAVIETE